MLLLIDRLGREDLFTSCVGISGRSDSGSGSGRLVWLPEDFNITLGFYENGFLDGLEIGL